MKNIPFFSITNLHVSVAEKKILENLSLSVESGSIHAIMGPNGSGKSSFAYALAGHPNYQVTADTMMLDFVLLNTLSPHERAKAGLFLAFQHPCEIPGVSVFSFLKEAYSAVKSVQVSAIEFQEILFRRFTQLGIDYAFASRGLHEGFSGGEKKRLEMLQLLLLQPKIAILDEIDSGLDIDALKIIAAGIEMARNENPSLSIIIITHYQRILQYVRPHYVHILCNGRFVLSGDATLADKLELQGYGVIKHAALS